MIIQKKSDIVPSEITPKHVYDDRRKFLQQAGFGLAIGASGLLSSPLLAATSKIIQPKVTTSLKLPNYAKSKYGAGEKLTSFEDVTSYNNYYEFGTGKDEPAINAKLFKPTPWSVSIEDILKLVPLEERIYRMRCVEGWSMVIPWIGLPLAQLIKWAEPTANAKYVEFVSLGDVQQMPGINLPILDWPYTEGLRMDEAMNPLPIMAVGLYGDVLPNQNGAPMRLIVPWKYGFKGGKAIVKIRFTEKMPQTTWMKAGPSEYGFYANVNPQVEHPRWSQSTEKRIGNGLFAGRIKTQIFNGYAEQVGQMYAGMDLRKYF
jgi:sulfoxide reductase catalytic subunit YedY